MSFIDDMAAAEARHKRDGFDLQWVPIDPGTRDASPQKNYSNWKVVYEDFDCGDLPIVIRDLILCERPSGANAEANHAAFQKSRDRVAAELAQYQTADSINDIAITRHIGSKEEFAELMDELGEKERRG